MERIGNLLEVGDRDIVEVVIEETNEVVARGHWYQDNVLEYSSKCGFSKWGYQFRKIN